MIHYSLHDNQLNSLQNDTMITLHTALNKKFDFLAFYR